ncbi:hypothetical protein [Haladaptatus cibarius]|uniref:hypothetical protein n=1 Tax=Haladaptatus cibarius TaxID=453847 RepID=UPI00067951A0|nr:hypothetical protein [Haladaptatus cibarius]
MPLSIIPDTEDHIADTNLFIAFGRPESGRFALLERIAQEHDIVFTIPQRVYEELSGGPNGYATAGEPIDLALDRGWATFADELAYANPVVSNTMDIVQRYIATATEQDADTVEKADSAIGGVAAQLLDQNKAESVTVYTADKAARRGIEVALTKHGYGDRVKTVDTFALQREAHERYESP